MKSTLQRRPTVSDSSTRGSVVVPALVLVVIVSTMSMIFIQQSLAKNKEQRMSVDSKRAFYMAEAGLSEAFNGLCIGKSGNVGSPDEPARFANGVFWTTATEEGQGRVTLQSTGLCGAGRATLSIVVERAPDTIGAMGFFGDTSVNVASGAVIDSYDSHAGPYVPLAGGIVGALAGGGLLPTGARVSCNGDITVDGTAVSMSAVLGDARPGPTGTLFNSAYSVISGSTAPSLSVTPLPPVTPPAVTVAGTLEATAAGVEMASNPGVQGLAEVKLRPNTIMRIVGPAVVVTRALTLSSRSALVLDATNGPVRVFVTSAINFANDAGIKTVTQDPLNVSLQIAAPGNLSILSPTSFYGTIYAPNADVKLGSGFQVFGSVGAKSLTVAAGAKLHFDEALANGDAHEDGTPRVLGWRIVQLPQVDIVNLRYDALKKLRDLGVTVVDGKNAHVDIGVTPP